MRKEEWNMKNKHKVSSAVNFGGWGWFLVLICIVYQMMYSAFAVDGINGYGASLAAYLSQVSGTEITSDMLTAMLRPPSASSAACWACSSPPWC